MLKKVSLFLLILLLTLSAISANSQKGYMISSDAYQKVSKLCMLYGVAGPSSAAPVSGSELLIALDRINTSNLNEEAAKEIKELYRSIENENEEDFTFSSKLTISPELYLQTAKDNAIASEDWILPYRDRKDAMKLSMEILVDDYIYGEFAFGIKEWYLNQFSKNFHYNIPALNGEELQRSVPDVAGISIGSEHSHLYIGRNRQSLGNGYSGNLMVGDNFYFQNFGKFSIHTKPFTYNLSITYFDRQKNTAISDYNTKAGRNGGTQLENFGFSGPQQIRVIQNYQMTFFDKLTLSLNFGNLFDTDNAFDLRMINPFMFMHNLFNFTSYNENDYGDGAKVEANNHASLALSYAFYPSWNLYTEIMIDQFQLAGEKSSTAIEPPNAIGALLNVSNTTKAGCGFLQSYAEVVYTSPNLYLNEKYTDANNSITSHDKASYDYYYWNQDLILGNSIWWGNDISYSGYVYGPDTILAEIGSKYETDIFSVGAKIRYKAHGEQGIRVITNQNQTIHHADSVWNLNLTGTVEHAVSLMLNGSWNITPSISINGAIAQHIITNYKNEEGAKLSNSQFTLGLVFKAW